MWITGFDVPSCSTIYLDKPMKNHTLMQTIARANRVFPEKHNGLIVDYAGIFNSLERALSVYGDSNVSDTPIKDKEELKSECPLDEEKRFNQYAFELSGGMRQRAMIAMALSTMPKLLLADEPTTALDVTIQAQVINLMKDIIKEYNMGVIFITHDLGVIAQVADDVAVMYLGSVVEQGPVNEILKNPMHPYTKGLINALPDINNLDAPLTPIPGNIPSPLDRPAGCVFRTRCPHASQDGKESKVKMGLVEVKPGHWLCLLYTSPSPRDKRQSRMPACA